MKAGVNAEILSSCVVNAAALLLVYKDMLTMSLPVDLPIVLCEVIMNIRDLLHSSVKECALGMRFLDVSSVLSEVFRISFVSTSTVLPIDRPFIIGVNEHASAVYPLDGFFVVAEIFLSADGEPKLDWIMVNHEEVFIRLGCVAGTMFELFEPVGHLDDVTAAFSISNFGSDRYYKMQPTRRWQISTVRGNAPNAGRHSQAQKGAGVMLFQPWQVAAVAPQNLGGLLRPGNNCFLNCFLQIFCYSEVFYVFFDDAIFPTMCVL